MTGQVVDAFMFNDELDLLELRLRVLDPVVDRFVLVESDRSHAGNPKPLFFDRHRERFEPWLGKIRHEVATLDEVAESPWRREEQHRRAVGAALADEEPSTSLFLIGDVDEIPHPHLVPWLDRTVDEPERLRLDHAMYFANWYLPQPWDNSTLAFRPGQLDEPMLRAQLGRPHDDWEGYTELQVDDAGVHLQFVNGPALIRSKWATYTHQEFNHERYNAAPHLERCLALGVDFTGRNVLRRAGRAALSPWLADLAADPAHAWLFDFSEPGRELEREAYCGYTWLRTQPRVPLAALRLIDRHPRLRQGPFALPFAGLHRALTWRRRRRQQPDWRAPRRVQPPSPDTAGRCT